MQVSRTIQAAPAAVYRALVDPGAIEAWRAPEGMSCTVHEFDVREGGRFRVSLSYDDADTAGKSGGNTDTYHGRFGSLQADRRVVEAIEFETDDPALQGEMTVITTLAEVDGATAVTVAYENLPAGVAPADNELGTRMSLDKLAAFVEGAAELERARYAAMRWNTPLSPAHADRLLELLETPAAATVLDLGCGWGELLLRALAGAPDARGVGVDSDRELLARGERLARERGLDARVRFVAGAAERWEQPAERLLCIGASHAWGDAGAALVRLRGLAGPGARLLFGEGCWPTPPTPPAARIFGEQVAPLHAIAEHARAAGWRILHCDTADPREWDEFESSWRRGREAWLAAHPAHPSAADVRAQLDARVMEYLRDYRGVLGFCYLVLAAA